MKPKKIIPIILLFGIVNSLLIALYFTKFGLAIFKFNFILVVNFMLFGISIFNFIRYSNLETKKPHAFVNTVMIGTLVKMLVFAGAALIYARQVKTPVGIPTLLCCMSLYLLYTWLEINWTKTKK